MENSLRIKLRNVIEGGTILEHLEEVGYIKIDHLLDFEVENLDNFIIVLDDDYNLPCSVSNDLRGQILVNKNFKENKKY